MVISIKYSELYSNSYCKVKVFFPKLQCFLIFFEFRKEYYETQEMPIRIITDTDRHTHFFKLSIKFTSYAMASDSLS